MKNILYIILYFFILSYFFGINILLVQAEEEIPGVTTLNEGYCKCIKMEDGQGTGQSDLGITKKDDCHNQSTSDGEYECQWLDQAEESSEGSGKSDSKTDGLLSSVEGISDLNQIKKYNNLQGLIGGFIKTAMGVMGSIALIMVVYGGFTAMTAAGNAERVKKGTEILLWSGLGIVVIFASYMIVDLVFEAFR